MLPSSAMEAGIIKTLAYADIFDYPLTTNEIHRFLIGEKATKSQVKFVLQSLVKLKKVCLVGNHYFLPGREKIVARRINKARLVKNKMKMAILACRFLQILPQIRLIGVSGGLAVGNVEIDDDIDFFVITSKNQLWTTRLLATAILNLSGLRRTPKSKSLADKICLNMFIDERSLEIIPHDLYLAHEVLQMIPLFNRDNTYEKFISTNKWAYNFLPNWPKSKPQNESKGRLLNLKLPKINIPGFYIEDFAKKLQLNYMAKRRTIEKITAMKIQFHPKDRHSQVLQVYFEKLKLLNLI